MIKNQIVSDGLRRLLKAPETREQINQAIAEIKKRFDLEMQGAGLFTRVALWFRMRKAIREATDKIVPSRGCYLRK